LRRRRTAIDGQDRAPRPDLLPQAELAFMRPRAISITLSNYYQDKCRILLNSPLVGVAPGGVLGGRRKFSDVPVPVGCPRQVFTTGQTRGVRHVDGETSHLLNIREIFAIDVGCQIPRPTAREYMALGFRARSFVTTAGCNQLEKLAPGLDVISTSGANCPEVVETDSPHVVSSRSITGNTRHFFNPWPWRSSRGIAARDNRIMPAWRAERNALGMCCLRFTQCSDDVPSG